MELPTKILIDTNIIINLEDNREVQANYSNFHRLCSDNKIQLLIHASSFDDIKNDKDEERRKISLSKLSKYSKVKKTPRTQEQKEQRFGKIKGPNDEVDTDLLVSLSVNVADWLISEDRDLISRVENSDLATRVFTVAQALELFETSYGTVPVLYKNVLERTCDEYHHDDKFFDSLKLDYGAEGFSKWYEEKCMREQRNCWVIEHNDHIAGMIIYKEEADAEELKELSIPGSKVLKICLFKTSETIRGEKYGEQLLKTAMDYAYRNGFESTFLTVLPHHRELTGLIEKFGFTTGKKKGQEKSYYKYSVPPEDNSVINSFDFHRTYWPCIMAQEVSKYVVPITPVFHARLFPDAHEKLEDQIELDLNPVSQITGNTIRKVYICNAALKEMAPGSIVCFYRTEDQLLTSIGVLEEYISTRDPKQLREFVGRRSVYSNDELKNKINGKNTAKAMNFYFATDLENPVDLHILLNAGILKGSPQSISIIPNQAFNVLLESISQNDRGIFYA